MISISERSWIYRLYAWSIGICGKFTDQDLSGQLTETNLCAFVRSILIWVPLIILGQLATISAVICAIVVVPVRLFGLSGYLLTLVAIALSILALVGLVFTVSGSAKTVKRLAHSEPVSLAVQYISARKRKFCPLIRFV